MSKLRLITKDSKSKTEEEEKERLTIMQEEDLFNKIRISMNQRSTDLLSEELIERLFVKLSTLSFKEIKFSVRLTQQNSLNMELRQV